MRAVAFAAALLASLSPLGARAQTCARPTDAGGYAGYAYAGATAEHFDSERARVWYVRDGKHGVRLATTRADRVPDDVARVAEVTELALAGYRALGFRPPPGDLEAPCEAGGDARLDVYLVAFGAADGTTALARCVEAGASAACASFILAERNFEGRYATVDEGIRTVVPHEVFHAVQNAYAAGTDRFWAEGTAQWATKLLDPSLRDLERHLPAFFADPSRSIDAPAGGVTASYAYGAAIWPVFLGERHGGDIVRAVLDEQAARGTSALAAADAVLARGGTSVGAELARFALWNAATGARAVSGGGYTRAADYPEVSLAEAPLDGPLDGVLSGAGAHYHRVRATGSEELALEADPARVAASVVPLVDGRAPLDRAASLPARIDGDAILVVSGTSTKKSDARYRVTRRAVVAASAPPASAPAAPAERGPAPPAIAAPDETSGCSASPARPGGGAAACLALATVGLSLTRRRGKDVS